MLSDEVVARMMSANALPTEAYAKLLSVYVAPADWERYIIELYTRLLGKFGKDAAGQMTKQAVCFTILLPTLEPGLKLDTASPQRLLFGCRSFSQFEDQDDWFEHLKAVVLKDQQIAEYRKEILQLGYIDPIDYQPFCRQAFKWLCERAEKEGSLTPEVEDKFRKLVMTYGGAVITYLFTKHSGSLKNVANWRTGYFVEKVIHKVYDLDQIKKIKRAELQKTNEKWVKSINAKTNTNTNDW